MSLIALLVLVVVIAAVFGIIQAVGVGIPANVMTIIWIVLAAVVAIWAIKTLLPVAGLG